MMETAKESPCPHTNCIENRGDVICQDCGAVLDKVYEPGYYMPSVEHGKYIIKNNRYVNWGTSLSYDGLGTEIGIGRNTEQQFKFRRLQKYHKLAKNGGTFLRVMRSLNNVVNLLNIPRIIHEGAALRYRKLIKEEDMMIKNHVSAVFYCLWHSIQTNNYPLAMETLLKTVRVFNHFASKRMLLRDEGLYGTFLGKSFPAKTNGAHDYLQRIIGSLHNIKDTIRSRLKLKKIPLEADIFLTTLQKFTVKVLKFLEPQLRYFGGNPVNIAAAAVYSSQRVWSQIHEYKQPLTQSLMSEATGLAESSIRDVYMICFKPHEKVIIARAEEQKRGVES